MVSVFLLVFIFVVDKADTCEELSAQGTRTPQVDRERVVMCWTEDGLWRAIRAMQIERGDMVIETNITYPVQTCAHILSFASGHNVSEATENSVSQEIPKSMSFRHPSAAMRRLRGLMSRCAISLELRNATAAKSWNTIDLATTTKCSAPVERSSVGKGWGEKVGLERSSCREYCTNGIQKCMERVFDSFVLPRSSMI